MLELRHKQPAQVHKTSEVCCDVYDKTEVRVMDFVVPITSELGFECLLIVQSVSKDAFCLLTSLFWITVTFVFFKLEEREWPSVTPCNL